MVIVVLVYMDILEEARKTNTNGKGCQERKKDGVSQSKKCAAAVGHSMNMSLGVNLETTAE